MASQGFVWITTPMTLEGFDDLSNGLGIVADTTVVRVDPTVPTYLCGHDTVPFHTDHADVDLIAWFCVEQDEADGACLLVDGQELARGLPGEHVAALRNLRIRHRGAAESYPVLSGNGRIFFAPWLQPQAEDSAAFDTFRVAVDRHPTTEVRLLPGQVLIIDNCRMLHGRAAISPRSQRRLVRHWIRIEPVHGS